MRVSFDIDGILTNYPECWVRYANNQLGTNYDSKEEMVSELGPKYSEIKSQYRKSDNKANINPKQKFVKVIKNLNNNGNDIIVATSRPIDSNEFPNLRGLTKKWLMKNSIPHKKLVKKRKITNINIDYHIEDELEDAQMVAKSGSTVYLYSEMNIDGKYIKSFTEPETLLSKIE
jgi:uncharacterized HAD superfamily protein